MSNEQNLILTALLERSDTTGLSRSPASLHSLFVKNQTNIQSLLTDSSHQLFDALRCDFPMLSKITQGYPLTDDEEFVVIELFRWIKQPQFDMPSGILALIFFVISTALNAHELIGRSADKNILKILHTEAERYLAALRCDFSVPSDALMYEKDLITRWKKAADTHDFKEISKLWLSFRSLYFNNWLMKAAISCLSYEGEDRLINAADTEKNPLVVKHWVELLPQYQRYRIAHQCNNIWFLFFSLEKWEPGLHRENIKIEPDTHDDIIKCFIKAGQDENFFRILMQIFNQYPSRYTNIQNCLGKALTKLSNSCLAIYADSINIRAINLFGSVDIISGVQEIELCLHSFLSKAVKPQIDILLGSLYHKWEHFVTVSEDKIHEVSATNLDYAASYWIYHHFPEIEIEELLQSCHERVYSFRNRWHEDVIDCFDYFLRILIEFNVYCIAHNSHLSGFFRYESLAENGFGFEPRSFRVPPELARDTYWILLFPQLKAIMST